MLDIPTIEQKKIAVILSLFVYVSNTMLKSFITQYKETLLRSTSTPLSHPYQPVTLLWNSLPVSEAILVLSLGLTDATFTLNRIKLLL